MLMSMRIALRGTPRRSPLAPCLSIPIPGNARRMDDGRVFGDMAPAFRLARCSETVFRGGRRGVYSAATFIFFDGVTTGIVR